MLEEINVQCLHDDKPSSSAHPPNEAVWKRGSVLPYSPVVRLKRLANKCQPTLSYPRQQSQTQRQATETQGGA